MKNKKKKICMLAARHSPFDARITYKEGMSLKNAGYEIVVIAPYKNKFSNFNGIKIIGFKMLKRSMRRANTLINLVYWGIKTKADVYHCHEVDTSLFAGIWIKKILKWRGIKAKLIYDSHEHWPALWSQQSSFLILRKMIYFIVNYWEKWALKHCDAVFTANKIVKKHLLSLNRKTKIEVLYNCPTLKPLQNKQNNKKLSHTTITICHEGMLNFDRGLREMIECIKKIKEELNNNIRLLIIGDIFIEKEKKWLRKKIIEYKLEKNIEITGWLLYPKINKKIQKCNIGLILFKPTLNNQLAGPPNKLFNYMQHGLPVIAPNFCFETKDIINKINCGLLVDAIKTKNIYNSIKYMLINKEEAKKMGENGRKAVLEKYNWENESKKLLKVYQNL